MPLNDWAATWNPVPDDRPCRVWTAAEPPARLASAPRLDRPPRRIVLALSAADAEDLPCRLSELLGGVDVRLGDAVTVDLGSATSVHLTGLELLLSALWRRVGPSGDVTLAGGTPGLRAELRSLGISPGASRAAVFGAPPEAPLPPAPVPAPSPRSAAALDIPSPRQASRHPVPDAPPHAPASSPAGV